MLHKIFQSHFNTFIFVTLGYLLIHFTNFALTDFLYLVPGAHLVHIPSGFKLLFVLVGGLPSAIGIATAALIGSLLYQFPENHAVGFQFAVMNGMAPYIAKKLVVDHLGMNEDMSHITGKQLVAAGLLFAFLNSGLNQGVMVLNGVSSNFLDSFLVMFLGDITGVYIVFLLLKLLSKNLGKASGP